PWNVEARVRDRQIRDPEMRFVNGPGGELLDGRVDVQRAVLDRCVERDLAGLDTCAADLQRQVAGGERRDRALDVLGRIAHGEVAELDAAVAECDGSHEHAPLRGLRGLGRRRGYGRGDYE